MSTPWIVSRLRRGIRDPRRFCHRRSGSIISLVILILLCLPCRAAADELAPVRMRLEPWSLRARSGGPISLRIKLEYNETSILEGDLLLRVFNGSRDAGWPLCRLRFDGIVLNGGDSFFDAMLPPLPDSTDQSYEIEAWFETQGDRIPLSTNGQRRIPPDTYSVIANRSSVRGAVVCSVSARIDPERLTPQRRLLHNLLSPESLVSDQERQSKLLLYFPAPRRGTEMPENPLALCGYDITLLTDGALKQLDRAQLQALFTWTEAGGSLLVVPTDKGLQTAHVEFLQQLFPERAAQFTLDDEGVLMGVDGTLQTLAACPGLGRCVLIANIDWEQFRQDEHEWIRRFLWKVRGSRLPAGSDVVPTPSPSPRRATADGQQVGQTFLVPGYLGLATQQGSLSEWCRMVLMPRDVTMVPTSVIAGILLTYVLAIGPFDYCLLGWLRLRRLTWLLFPIVTFGFTVLMIWVAHSYLASNETGSEFRITDVGDQGRPLRETVIDLKYVGARQEIEQPVRAGLVTPVVSQPMMMTQGKPLSLSGRFPQDYSSVRRLEQWEPDMQRTFSLAPADLPPLPLDWNDVALVTTLAGRMQLREQLTARADLKCLRISVFHADTGFDVYGGRIQPMRAEAAWRQLGVPQAESVEHAEQNVVDEACRASPRGFFRYVAQVSPGGAAEMEDVAILDAANPDQWLLAILLQTDEGYHLVRKLYTVRRTPEGL